MTENETINSILKNLHPIIKDKLDIVELLDIKYLVETAYKSGVSSKIIDYNRVPESNIIRQHAMELDEKDFDQWWWETVYKELSPLQ